MQGVYVQVNNRILEGGLAIIYMIKLQPNKKLTSNQPHTHTHPGLIIFRQGVLVRVGNDFHTASECEQ